MATIITVSGISGSGKTTIVENTVNNFPELYHKVVTTTTRQPRDGEENGVDYFFMKKNDFENKIKEGFFLENELISGNFYGTQVDQLIDKKTIPIIIVGPEGSQNFKKILEEQGHNFISVFIECDIETAKKRITKRDESNPLALMKRLNNIDNFEYKWQDFDYTLRLKEGSDYKDFISLINDYLSKQKKINQENNNLESSKKPPKIR